jgi:hypothetical protein
MDSGHIVGHSETIFYQAALMEPVGSVFTEAAFRARSGFGVKPLLLASSHFNTQLGWRVFDGKRGNDSIQLYQAYKVVNATGRIGYYEFHALAQSPFSDCGQDTQSTGVD